MKKKIGAILMAGMMSFAALAGLAFTTACIGRQKADFVMPEEGFDINKPVTISFYHIMGAQYRTVLDEAIADFNLLYPNITVEHKIIGNYNDVRDQVNNEIMAGNQPDIAYCYPDHVALYNKSGAVQSLNDFLVDGAYKNTTVPQVKVENGKQVLNDDGSYVIEQVPLNLSQEQTDSYIEGYYNEGFKFGDESKMYMLPFSKSTEIMYYNKTFFETNNLKVPETWDEMEEVCKKIRTIDPDNFPFAYDSEANWFITMCEQSGSPYTSSSGENFLFDNAKNHEFVERFTQWYKDGYFITQEINGGSYTSNLFKNAQAYMCIGSSAGASNQMPALSGNGTYPFEVGIAPIPQVDPDNPKVISQGPSVCILKQDDPQRVLASWLLLKYLTTSVDFQARFSTIGGYVPVLNQETMATNAVYKNLLDSAEASTSMTAETITAIAALTCMQQEKAYFTSPAFIGSTDARDQVGYLMTAAFTYDEKKYSSIADAVNAAFKTALEECKYAAS